MTLYLFGVGMRIAWVGEGVSVGVAANSSGSGLQKQVLFVQFGLSPHFPSAHISPPEQSLSVWQVFLQSTPRLQQNHEPSRNF